MINIAVLVSGGGTNLQALLDKQDSFPTGKIMLVLSSDENAYALERAKNFGVQSCVVARKNYADRQTFTNAILDQLKEKNIDLVIMSGFMYILSPIFTDIYQNRVINIHPSLIPAFCGDGYYGLKVHQAVLAKGVKITGATVHFVNDICDGGPIILQKAIDVLQTDSAESLQKRVMEQCEWIILPEAVKLFCENRLKVEENRVRLG